MDKSDRWFVSRRRRRGDGRLNKQRKPMVLLARTQSLSLQTMKSNDLVTGKEYCVCSMHANHLTVLFLM